MHDYDMGGREGCFIRGIVHSRLRSCINSSFDLYSFANISAGLRFLAIWRTDVSIYLTAPQI